MAQNDPRANESTTIKRKNRKKYFSVSFRCFCPFLVVVGPFSGVQNRIYGIIRARIVRNGAKWPHGKGKYNYNKKKGKNSFWRHFGVFLSLFVRFSAFWGVQNRKMFEKFFFAGIDLEWSETHFEPKISRKTFSFSFKNL